MWIKMTTCPICKKRVRMFMAEHTVESHKYNKTRCVGSYGHGTDSKYEWKEVKKR